MKKMLLLIVLFSSSLFALEKVDLKNTELKTVCVSDITISNSKHTKFLNVLVCIGTEKSFPDQIAKNLILNNVSSLTIGLIVGSDGFNILTKKIQENKPKNMLIADIVKLTFYDNQKFIGDYKE